MIKLQLTVSEIPCIPAVIGLNRSLILGQHISTHRHIVDDAFHVLGKSVSITEEPIKSVQR